jgi:hypothetical protein
MHCLFGERPIDAVFHEGRQQRLDGSHVRAIVARADRGGQGRPSPADHRWWRCKAPAGSAATAALPHRSAGRRCRTKLLGRVLIKPPHRSSWRNVRFREDTVEKLRRGRPQRNIRNPEGGDRESLSRYEASSRVKISRRPIENSFSTTSVAKWLL